MTECDLKQDLSLDSEDGSNTGNTAHGIADRDGEHGTVVNRRRSRCRVSCIGCATAVLAIALPLIGERW